MRTPILLLLATALLGLTMSGCTNGPTSEAYAQVTTKTKKTMRAFKSEKDLREYLKPIAAKQRAQSDFWVGKQLQSGGATGLFTVYDGNAITNLKGRVFALLGYELVEGEVADGRIREKRRSNYAPQFDSARN